MEINNIVEYIINKIQKNNFNAYVVGGCVRDSLINKIPKDWDIATNATPDQVKSIFNDINIVDTGIEHGTVTLFINKEGYEVTTFRIDGNYSNNRKPDEIFFVSDIKEDLSRRDFTFNAMAYNHNEGLIDPFNGSNDLHNKIIRCIGNANERMNEDYLRALRAIRFACKYNFIIEHNTFKAILNNSNLINLISQERINNELSQILIHNPIKGINLLNDLNLLKYIIPELYNTINVKQNNPYHIYDVFNHIVNSTNNIENTLYLRLTMLLHDIAKPETKTTDENGIDHFYNHATMGSTIAENILRRLTFDLDTITKVKKLIELHDCKIPTTITEVKKLLNKTNEQTFIDLMKVKKADMQAQSKHAITEKSFDIEQAYLMLNTVLTEKHCFTKKDLKINGNDIINIGIKEGKQIGIIINKLIEIVIENPDFNTKEKLIEIISNL